MAASQRQRHRRWVMVPLVVVVTLFVLLTVATLLINHSSLPKRLTDAMLPKVSDSIGRSVEVGDVHIQLFPRVGATVSNVTVAGAPGEPPLLSSDKAAVSLELWPLLISRGHDIQVASVELRDLDVNLVRRPDGHWSYEDLTKAKPSEEGKETEPEKNGTPEKPPQFAVGEIKLVNGQIKVIDETASKRGAQVAATAALSQIDLTAHHVGAGLPASVELSAALASDKQNISGSVSIDPLPASADALTAGPWPKVTGKFEVDNLPLQHLAALIPGELEKAIRGGCVNLTVDVKTDAQGIYASTARAKLDQLQLRGSPVSGGFVVNATVDPAKPKSLSAHVTDLQLKGPGIDLEGTASYQAAGERLRFALAGQELNTDELLGALPPSAPSHEAQAAKKPPERKEQPLLTSSMRRTTEKADVEGTLTIKAISAGKLRAQDLRAKVTLDKGVLTLAEGRLGLYGGQATLDGTKVNLVEDKPVWDVAAKLQSVKIGEAIQEFSGSSPLTGTVDGTLTARGSGNDWDQIRPNLVGKGQVKINGELTKANIIQQIELPLAAALQKIGKGSGAPSPSAGQQTTPLKNVTIDMTIKDGWLQLTQPVVVDTSAGTLSLGGRIGLDERLDLEGKANLTQALFANVSGGAFQPKGPVTVPLKIGGTLSAPKVTGVAWGDVIRQSMTQGLEQKGKSILHNLVPGL